MKLKTAVGDRVATRYSLAVLSLLFFNQIARDVSAAAAGGGEPVEQIEESNQIKAFARPNSNAISKIFISSRHSKELSKPTLEKSRQVDGTHNVEDLSIKWLKHLQEQMMQHLMQQQISEKDHILMEKWLVDNINDLHRELKQTETDFEHYVQVTKNIMARNECQSQQQVAASTAMVMPLPFPLQPDQFLSPMQSGKQQAVQPLRRLIFPADTMDHEAHRWV